MLQVKRFALPTEEASANEFLATHKADQVALFSDAIVFTHDDGTYPREYEIAELRGLIQAAGAAKTQQTVALGVLNSELPALTQKRDDAVVLVAKLQGEHDALNKHSQKGPRNEKAFHLKKAEDARDQANARLEETIRQRDSVVEAIENQDTKIKVIEDTIADLQK